MSKQASTLEVLGVVRIHLATEIVSFDSICAGSVATVVSAR